jgi:carbonic anhydrase
MNNHPRFLTVTLLAAAALLTLTPLTASADDKAPVGAPTGDAVLKDLKSGNERFVEGKATHPHADRDRVLDTSKGQKPVATVLACSDSRVSPELVLDQGIGDIFVVRVAGNVADTNEIGSIEYATEHLHTPLLVVMGHTKCGAVTAVVENTSLEGSIPALISHIKPALDKSQNAQAGLAKDQFVEKVIKENVWDSVEDILKRSEIVRKLVASGKLKLVGGVYDIATGKIDWMGAHPNQAQLIAAK